MPFYLITIETAEDKVYNGIRSHSSTDIDEVFDYFHKKALGGKDSLLYLLHFDCKMISTKSPAYEKWLQIQKAKLPKDGRTGGRYRQ